MSHQKRGQPRAPAGPRRPGSAEAAPQRVPQRPSWASPLWKGLRGARNPGELGAGNRIQNRSKDRGLSA